MLVRQAKEERELEEARKNAPETDPADEEEEEERWMESDLAKRVRQKKLEEQKQQWEKAKTFSKDMNEGRWKPKMAVSVIDTKKKKKMKKLPIADIQSLEEDKDDDEDEPLPEGFHLLEESVHCINIRKSEEFKAYLNEICTEFIKMVQQGHGVEEEYRKVVRSTYWACKAVGNGSLINDADPECVAGSVKDLNCIAWKLKLTGKTQAVPKELLVNEEEDPQVAIETMDIGEKEVYERIKDKYDKMSPEKQKELTHHVQGILHSNALAHKHTAAAAEHLSDASRLLSMPATVALSNATARPLVGVHLPIMNKFIQEAQKKHEENVQQRQKDYKPIDEICIDQNLPRNAREWEYRVEGDANRHLAAVVTRYMYQAMMRDKKQFYSGIFLGRMFDVPPSTLNKLLSRRKYMGGAELEKYREEMKRNGVNIPKRRETKLGG